MSGIQFHETVMGRRFIEGTVPTLTRNIEKLTALLEESQKTREYCIGIIDPDRNAEESIQEELKKGAHVKMMQKISENFLIVIFTISQGEEEKKNG